MNAEPRYTLTHRIRLDFRSGVPIYLQIVEQMRQLIMGGVLRPGDQLPTVRALAAELRVNFNTVARAYRLLDEEGVISTQQGRGTYVTGVPSPEEDDRLRREALEALTRRYLQDVRRLGYAAAEALEALRRVAETLQEDEDSSTTE